MKNTLRTEKPRYHRRTGTPRGVSLRKSETPRPVTGATVGVYLPRLSSRGSETASHRGRKTYTDRFLSLAPLRVLLLLITAMFIIQRDEGFVKGFFDFSGKSRRVGRGSVILLSVRKGFTGERRHPAGTNGLYFDRFLYEIDMEIISIIFLKKRLTFPADCDRISVYQPYRLCRYPAGVAKAHKMRRRWTR